MTGVQTCSLLILIVQYSSGRFGFDEKYLKKADAIGIKFGQGAKPGQGGLLPAEKNTPEIAEVRKVEKGVDIHSPPSHSDISSPEDLKSRIKCLRELTGGKPIIVKIAGGHIEDDVRFVVEADPDIIAIDGMEGGTGAAPKVMLDQVGLPTMASLVRARKVLDELNAPQELWIGGGIKNGADAAKALALGADVIFFGLALMQAMGCTNCRQCYLGKCPLGIATQDPNLNAKLNTDEAGKKIADFLLGDKKFTTFVEFKKPDTSLFGNSKNRSNSWRLSDDFIDAVSQILEQKASGQIKLETRTLHDDQANEIKQKSHDSKVILIIGNWSEVDKSENDLEKRIKEKKWSVEKLI